MDIGDAALSGKVAGEVIIAHVHEVSGLSGSHFLFRIVQNVFEKFLEFAVHGGFPVHIIELHLIFLNEKGDQTEDIGALLKTNPGREILGGDVTVRMLLRKLGGGHIGYHRIQNSLQERFFRNREITVLRQIAGRKDNGNHLGKMRYAEHFRNKLDLQKCCRIHFLVNGVNGQRRDENQGILRNINTTVIEINDVLALFVIAQFIVGMRMRREAAAAVL